MHRGEIVPLENDRPRMFNIKPKNNGQRFVQEALLAPVDQAPLVIIKGTAGTAKTFLAIAAGLYQSRACPKVHWVRPNIKFDEEIGFLKGSEEEKIGPLMRPIVDNIRAIFPNESDPMYRLEQEGRIAFQAMAFMRGRSLVNTYLIVDEAQNMTPSQAFGIISRAGAGTKIVLAGDPMQIDNLLLDATNNGLVYAAEKNAREPAVLAGDAGRGRVRAQRPGQGGHRPHDPKGTAGDEGGLTALSIHAKRAARRTALSQ